MRKCSLEKMQDVFAQIASGMDLYLPVDGSDKTVSYAKWYEGADWREALNTVKSPKDFFFPQSEDLMRFTMKEKNIEITDLREDKEEFVVFGVRACDVKSFEILDRVFLSDPCDSFYASRREKGVIVSLACTRPSETCFCTAFGIHPEEPAGDVTCWKTETELFWQANTDKGAKLLALIEELTENASSDTVEKQKEKITGILNRLPLKDLSTEAWGGGKTLDFFNRPEWEELSQSCLSCGTCTFICPTCQCYDIKDFNTGNEIIRYRCWDSCMYSEFTKMAHGNNRNSQKERFRQRFMHKLVYYPENNDGLFGCVGCGRCLAKCPISMNIVKVMKKLGGEVHEETE